jgi:CRISPR-associated protein Cst2
MSANESAVLSHIAGTFLIHAEGSFLNGAGLDTSGEFRNFVLPKTYLDGRNRVPYVSSQAWRRWLRNTFKDENPNEPAAELKAIDWNAQGNPSKIATETDPIVYAEDDIFGYMRAAQGQGRAKEAEASEEDLALDLDAEATEEAEPKGKKKGKTERVSSVMRPSPFASSILKSLRSNGWQGDDEGYVHLKEGTPLPYKTRFYNTHLQGVFGLNYARLGVFRNEGDRVELDETLVKKYLNEKVIRASEKNANIYEVVNNKRSERAAMILRALSVLRGGAKQAQFGTEVSPKAIIIAGLNCGNLIFNDLFDERDGQPAIKLGALKETIEDYRQRLTTPVFIGVRDGYLHPQNETDLRSWASGGEANGNNARFMSPLKAVESLIEHLNKAG